MFLFNFSPRFRRWKINVCIHFSLGLAIQNECFYSFFPAVSPFKIHIFIHFFPPFSRLGPGEVRPLLAVRRPASLLRRYPGHHPQRDAPHGLERHRVPDIQG